MSYVTIAAKIRARIRCCINNQSINEPRRECRHDDTSEEETSDSDEIAYKNTKESGEKKNL